MFYDSLNPEMSMSVLSEYVNGQRIKETVYNEKYELLNTILADYSDEKRTKIKLLNPEGNVEIELD